MAEHDDKWEKFYQWGLGGTLSLLVVLGGVLAGVRLDSLDSRLAAIERDTLSQWQILAERERRITTLEGATSRLREETLDQEHRIRAVERAWRGR